MSEPREQGLDVRQWARLVWRRKWLLLAVVVVVPLAVYVGSSLLPKTYESTATINVKATAGASTLFSGQITPSSGLAETQTLVETTVVARRAAHVLGRRPSSARGLLNEISAEPTNPAETNGVFLTITAQASDPGEAAEVANAFAKAVAQTRTSNAIRSIDKTIATLIAQGSSGVGGEASRDALAEQLQQLRGLKAGQAGTTPIVEAAVPSDSPISPRPARNAVIALILSLLIAAALAPLLDRLDRRIREPSELEDLFEVPLLATVPDDAFPGHPPGSHVRESFQTLRASLTYFNIDTPLSTLVVASAAQQDGKTTVAINLAIAYALDERDVILVDADLRRPQVATRLGKEPGIGIDAVLMGDKSLDDALVEVDAGAGRLRILPGMKPPPNPAALLGSERMRTLLTELSERADIVLVDTPAILAVSDAIPLINQAAGTILVAHLGRTTKDAMQRANQVATSAGGTVIGTVATGAHAGEGYGYYGYGYYDSNGAEAGDDAVSGNGVGVGGRLLDRVRGGKGPS